MRCRGLPAPLEACGIFPDQEANPCPLHWQADPFLTTGLPGKSWTSQFLYRHAQQAIRINLYLWSHGLLFTRVLCHGDSPGKNTGVGYYALLRVIFLSQRSNAGQLHCRHCLYHLSLQESSRIPEWAASPFSRGSSWPRKQTGVSCTVGRFLTSWATKEVPWSRIPEVQNISLFM